MRGGSGSIVPHIRNLGTGWSCYPHTLAVLSMNKEATLHYELNWSVCICLTQIYDGRHMYIIYYVKNNYMFRHFTLAIFRLRNEKNLVSSYTRLVWVVYSGEVRGGVGTRSGVCCVGWVVWGTWVLLLYGIVG